MRTVQPHDHDNHFALGSHSTGLCVGVFISKERMLPSGEVVMVPLYLKLRLTPAHFMTPAIG